MERFSAGVSTGSGYPGVNKYSTPNPSQANLQTGALSWDPVADAWAIRQTWNLNIQRQLPFKMLLDVGYVGRRARAGSQRAESSQPIAGERSVLGSSLTSTVNSQRLFHESAGAGRTLSIRNAWTAGTALQTLSQFPQVLTVNYWRLGRAAGLSTLPRIAGTAQ